MTTLFTFYTLRQAIVQQLKICARSTIHKPDISRSSKKGVFRQSNILNYFANSRLSNNVFLYFCIPSFFVGIYIVHFQMTQLLVQLKLLLQILQTVSLPQLLSLYSGKYFFSHTTCYCYLHRYKVFLTSLQLSFHHHRLFTWYFAFTFFNAITSCIVSCMNCSNCL